METWKIVYYPTTLEGGKRGVALVEADSHSMAMFTFQQQYAGQFHTVESCKKLFE